MDENLVIDGGVTTITDANGGADTYTISPTLSADVTINDTDGATIILPNGLDVSAATFASTGLELTVNGFTVTILAGTNAEADLNTFIFGGNPLDPTVGTPLTFEETASAFGAASPDTLGASGTSSATVTGAINVDGTVGDGGGNGGEDFDEVRDLDALGGTQITPASTDVSTLAVQLTDSITAQNFVEVSGFGADDELVFGGGATADDISIDPGSDTLLTVNNDGLISQINLLGVSTGLSVQTVADFNALEGIGDIVIG